MSDDKNTTELPEELEQALQNVINARDVKDAMEAFAVLKKADDPSHQKILADRLETFSLETLSAIKEEVNNLLPGNYTPAALTDVFLAAVGEEVSTQAELNALLAGTQLITQITHYVSEHKQAEDLDSSLKSFIEAVSGLSGEEYNDAKILFGTMLSSVRDAAVLSQAENPFGNNGPTMP